MKEVTFGEAMKRKYPEWVVLVVTVDAQGKVDIMPAGWAMIASGKPPMFAVAVGHTRYTHELIAQAKEFVIAFPSPGMGQPGFTTAPARPAASEPSRKTRRKCLGRERIGASR